MQESDAGHSFSPKRLLTWKQVPSWSALDPSYWEMAMIAEAMKGWRAPALGIVLLLELPVNANAQQSADWSRCNPPEASGVSPDVQIAACTALILSAIETRWDHGVAFYKRGAASYFKGDLDRAIADYTEAMKLGLYLPDVLNNRAIAYEAKGDHARAIADLNEAIRLNPQHAGAFNNRGNAYQAQGDRARALADYTEAVRLDPNNADALNNRCWIRTLMDQMRAALDDCNGSLRLRPNDPEFLDSRGLAYLKLGQLDDAISDYDGVLRQDPRRAHALYGRGLAKIRKGDRQGGDADLAAATAINPGITDEFARRGVAPGAARPTLAATAAPVRTAAASSAAPATASGATTVKELFEKYDLIGTFAADCSMPVSDQNRYFVHRVNSSYVQRDSMTGPSTRAEASLIDSATEPVPNELDVTMTDERGKTTEVMSVGYRQWRLLESTRAGGERLIVGGRSTQGARRESPWLKKCS
jgi:tetratricopeptide (TPR) repeat protein